MISAKQVQELRQKTGVGMMEAKESLTVCNGNEIEAIEYLRKKGLYHREKLAGKKSSEGIIHSYIHAGSRIGVIIEVNCNTDFVARSDIFMEFVRDIALHITASKPIYLTRKDVPADIIEKEKEIIISQLNSEEDISMKLLNSPEVVVNKVAKKSKPAHIVDKIVAGKLEKFYSDVVLMDQAFIKDPVRKIEDLLNEIVSKVKENIVIKRFMIWQLGE